MCASHLSTTLFLFAAAVRSVVAEGAYGTSCSAAPLKGFAALKDGALVDGAGEPFVFASMNLPNIHRIELPEGGVRKPTLAEVADGLCSVQQMKGRVARTYVLSHGDGDLYHIDGGTVNEGWFAVLDQVIEVAEQLGVYVIIPFVNTFWRAAPRNSARNSAAAQFGRRAIPPRTSPTASPPPPPQVRALGHDGVLRPVVGPRPFQVDRLLPRRDAAGGLPRRPHRRAGAHELADRPAVQGRAGDPRVGDGERARRREVRRRAIRRNSRRNSAQLC